MISLEAARERMIAKLLSAQHDLGEVVTHALPVARYDPVAIPQNLRNDLIALREDLARIIRALEENRP